MLESFADFNVVTQALVATIATQLLTAVGTLPVLFLRSAPRRLMDTMMGFAGRRDGRCVVLVTAGSGDRSGRGEAGRDRIGVGWSLFVCGGSTASSSSRGIPERSTLG